MESPITTLGRILRPDASKSLPALVAWLDTITDVEVAKELARFCCAHDTLLGGYSREVVKRAFHATRNAMFNVVADEVRPTDALTRGIVDAHINEEECDLATLDYQE